jgi:chemotaxis protein CheX
MATPVVVSGIGHTISHKANGKKIIMPFSSPHGSAFIEICFEDVTQEPEAAPVAPTAATEETQDTDNTASPSANEDSAKD